MKSRFDLKSVEALKALMEFRSMRCLEAFKARACRYQKNTGCFLTCHNLSIPALRSFSHCAHWHPASLIANVESRTTFGAEDTPFLIAVTIWSRSDVSVVTVVASACLSLLSVLIGAVRIRGKVGQAFHAVGYISWISIGPLL